MPLKTSTSFHYGTTEGKDGSKSAGQPTSHFSAVHKISLVYGIVLEECIKRLVVSINAEIFFQLLGFLELCEDVRYLSAFLSFCVCCL